MLDLISDTDKYLFTKKCMREGVSYIALTYFKTNNKLYSHYQSSKHNIFLDAKKWNVWAISQYLLTGGFKSLTQNKIKNLMLIKLKKIINGCTTEADLDYLKELQSLHNNYLLFPVESDIKKSMLFDYYRQIMSK